MRRTDALIAGGGPAGAAVAIRLARGGATPLLIERQTGPRDVVCGGFLGRDALAALDALGVDVKALGARPITRLRLIAGDRTAEADLPFAAAGLSRRALDEALLEQAEQAGARIERGVAIRAAEGPLWALRLDDGATIATDALFLATGKHELRGLARPRGEDGGAVGMRVAIDPGPALRDALAGVIELHLFRGGYAGLLLQEDGRVNLCLSIARARLAEGGGATLAAIDDAPRLQERFGGGSAGAWSAIAGVPYGWRAEGGATGLFRLGDQAAVIASLAGDGVAIALASARLAAEHYLASGSDGAAAYQRAFARHARRPIAIAGMLRSLAEGRIARTALPLIAGVPGLAARFARLTRIG